MPVYNKRPFLPLVVAGLKAQCGEFAREFVFVDDGSTDGSGAALRELTAGWADVRIIEQPNRGPSVATNRGIEAARYPYVKLVDGDDVLLPWATARLLQAIRAHDGAVFAYGRAEPYRTAQDVADRLAAAEPAAPPVCRCDADPLPGLIGHFAIGPSNGLLLTDAARQVGGCDARVFVQDFSLAIRLATAGSFVAVDEVVTLIAGTAPGRVNDSGPQVLHDLNLALAHFLAERHLPSRLAVRAIRRATGRAWHWARRREGAGLFSIWTLLRLRAALPRPPVGLVAQSCGAFTLSRPVRRIGP